MPKSLGLNVPLTPEQYRDTNLPHALAARVADAINSTIGTNYRGYAGFQGDSINISLLENG